MNRNEITPAMLANLTPVELLAMTPEVLEVYILATYRYDNAITPAVALRVRYTDVVRRAAMQYRNGAEMATLDPRYSDYVAVSLDVLKSVECAWFDMWPVDVNFDVSVVVATNRTGTPTPTPTPTYTAVGLPVMVQDGPCDVAECNGVPIASDMALSHRDMVDLWVMDFDIASHTHDTYHVATNHPISGDVAQWLVARCGKGWQYTPWVDVHPTIKATIWAGDMADKLATAGIDLATLATPEDVHCAIAQWLVDVDGNDPYDVDGIFVSMMIGNHSPADVAEKTIEDWYQRWVVLNAEAIDNGTYQPATKSTPTTTPATIDTTNDDDDDDDGYIINDVEFDDAYMTRVNAARRAYTGGTDYGLKFELWATVEKMISDGDTNQDIWLQLRRMIDDCIEAVSDATR